MAVDRGPQLAAVLGLFLGLAWLFVSLRAYVRVFITKSWGSDDYLLLLALAFFSTYCASSATGVHYGTGRHLVNIPPEDIPRALYFWWLCEIFYTLATVFVRLSIAVFLLRICVKPIQRWIIYGTMTMVVTFSTFYVFLVIFQCSPVRFFWDQYRGLAGSCIDPAVVPNSSIAHSVVSFTADWVLGLLPIALLWNVKMNMRSKVSVAALLSLGLLAGLATIIRVPYIKVLAITDDFLYATTDVAIWSTVEPGLGLIAAGGATLRPLFRSFYNNSSHRSSSHPYFPTSHTHSWKGKSHKSNASMSNDQDAIRLRTDVVDPSGVVTSVGSPFGDWLAVDEESRFAAEAADREGGGKGPMGGIQVSKTVKISTSQERVEGPEEIIENDNMTTWLRPESSSSERDMV